MNKLLIDNVAKAICKASRQYPQGPCLHCEDCTECTLWTTFRTEAEAAIQEVEKFQIIQNNLLTLSVK